MRWFALERRVVEAPHWAEAEYGAIVGGGGEGIVRRCLFVAETDEGCWVLLWEGDSVGG